MNEIDAVNIINHFALVSQRLTRKWHRPGEWQEFHSEMCFAFVLKNGSLTGKSLAYTIEVCKNEALNNYFKGTSICSKPRRGLRVVSYERLPESIATERRFEHEVRNKILVENIVERLTGREKQVAELIMQGDTQKEIAESLGLSQSRVNYLKNRIKRKAQSKMMKRLQ